MKKVLCIIALFIVASFSSCTPVSLEEELNELSIDKDDQSSPGNTNSGTEDDNSES